MTRLGLWLSVKQCGLRIPLGVKFSLWTQYNDFNKRICKLYNGAAWKSSVLHDVYAQPFLDLLNRPAGGKAYCGGVMFADSASQPTLHHFRGTRSIDTPLTSLIQRNGQYQSLNTRQFWCGPLAHHFGHQIADFGSRVLLSSVDPRGGELLWYPWKVSHKWHELQPWQKFLISYLNPGKKTHRICTSTVLIKELIVYPQQARMHSSPSGCHLEALSWCERVLTKKSNQIVYVSRSRFSACKDSKTLQGAFAGEKDFESMLIERGVVVMHPESLDIKSQLELYLGAQVLIVAEGSAQHGLELLGYHPEKQIFVICRRPQSPGMDLPLKSRFPNTIFIQALLSQWQSQKGVSWDGLAILDWQFVTAFLNPFLSHPFTENDCQTLGKSSEEQLKALARDVPLVRQFKRKS